jgi:hypothetical protein
VELGDRPTLILLDDHHRHPRPIDALPRPGRRGHGGVHERDDDAGPDVARRFDLEVDRAARVDRVEDRVLAEGQRRHVAGATTVVGRLKQLGAPVGPEAVETLAAISDVRFALVLQESYGWSLDQLERWITDASATLLLRP